MGVSKQRCWRYDWVVDLDIRKFFDTLDHELLMSALAMHCTTRWILLYVDRWLKAPVEIVESGRVENPGRGMPQGGVISPLLANLFLHYAFDEWMRRSFPACPFER